jgi:FkbM family methyltransferase
MQTLIQIGANDGNDEFRSYTEAITDVSDIYLFEPNPNLIPELENAYKNSIHNVKIFNVAITPEVKDYVELNIYDHSGLTSMLNRKSYTNRYGKIQVGCTTFDKFCEIEDIRKINHLTIDTEGLDYEILLSISLDKVEIDEIVFEIWPYDNDDGDGNYNTGPTFLKKVLEKYSTYTPEVVQYGGMASYLLTRNKYATNSI